MFKGKKVLYLVTSACIASAIAVTAAGCGDENSQSETPRQESVVSYLSAQTEVFSTTAEVVEKVADTVVEIKTEYVTTQWGAQYIVSGAGSGVIVGESQNTYYIITNNHVIEGANDITVTTRSGVKYEAELVATDDSADIAVVTVSSQTELPVAVWGDSDSLKIGEDMIAIGNPLGNLGGTVTKGILSATGRSLAVGNYVMTLLQTDTAINPGNSGGGLFNMRGELVGVVNAKTSDTQIEGICFAIPANRARSVYGDLVEYGYLRGRAALNATLYERTYNSGFANEYTRVFVSAAENAEEGTFMMYDKLYKVNGIEITSLLDYNTAMAKVKPGDSVEVQVYRGKISQSWFGSDIVSETQVTTFTVTAVQYGA